MRMLEKWTKVVVKNRCVVCKTPIPHGAIYCRAHLRAVLHHEEDLTHTARTKR
jgi:predicted nucleic acid-binding Zn ribbon protein